MEQQQWVSEAGVEEKRKLILSLNTAVSIATFIADLHGIILTVLEKSSSKIIKFS